MTSSLRALGVLVVVTLLGTTLGCVADSAKAGPRHQRVVDGEAFQASASTSSTAKPLARLTIALDPGHQLGNHNFPKQINKPVPAGGFDKPCNTTGTATNSGTPEATVNYRLALAVKQRLENLGAHVRMTRNTNSQRRWGPCVDARGRFGRHVHAVLNVSLHADGAPSSGHGFDVIYPTKRKPWTTDIYARSLRLAKALRSGLVSGGFTHATYVGTNGLDMRDDLGTLNMSDVPVAMIEIGNMRNAADARRMTGLKGRARYANAIVRGIRSYLRR